MITIKQNCKACNGTGVYKGLAEKDTFGVVCTSCGGTGCQEYSYEEFSGRKTRDGITHVGWNSRYVQGVSWNIGSIHYDRFLNGELPPMPDNATRWGKE